jgi:hypothetical protein
MSDVRERPGAGVSARSVGMCRYVRRCPSTPMPTTVYMCVRSLLMRLPCDRCMQATPRSDCGR